MINVDETDFLKKGKNSAGVMRQYCGRIGKVDSCQAGIFIGYASEKGYGLINGRLYVPEKWMDDEHADLRLKCKFPEEIKYKDKCSIFLDLLSEVRMSGYFPAKWIGCDSTFGANHKVRESLNKMGYYYFANIRSDMNIWPSMPEMRVANRKDKEGNPMEKWPTSKPISVYDFVIQDTSLWNEIVMGEGSKGPIINYIKTFRVYENIDGFPGREVWLYVRKFENGELKFAFCNAPGDTPLETLDKVALLRWSIEQCFEECKTELGMNHYEVRSYNGWHRHMLLVMVAHEFLCEVQNMLKKTSI
jgi:SRSO17 transposase